MNRINVLTALFSLLLISLAVQPSARGDEWNKKTIVTINAPVEIPGRVLAPGTYVFKLAESPSNRNIVQIWDKDETQVIATILAIPDYRPQPADTTIITFGENLPLSPPPVKEWFYPGDNYGQEFVYHRDRAMQVAKAANQNVLATTETSTEPKTLGKAQVTAVTPEGKDTETATAARPKP